jgi:hypothetical protein
MPDIIVMSQLLGDSEGAVCSCFSDLYCVRAFKKIIKILAQVVEKSSWRVLVHSLWRSGHVECDVQ